MQINYKLNSNDLDANFLEAVRLMFKGKDISISIVDAEDDEDMGLGSAIEKGLLSQSVSREELNKALHAD